MSDTVRYQLLYSRFCGISHQTEKVAHQGHGFRVAFSRRRHTVELICNGDLCTNVETSRGTRERLVGNLSIRRAAPICCTWEILQKSNQDNFRWTYCLMFLQLCCRFTARTHSTASLSCKDKTPGQQKKTCTSDRWGMIHCIVKPLSVVELAEALSASWHFLGARPPYRQPQNS